MNLNEKQLAMVDAQIKRLIKTDSYYGKIYRDAGIDGVSSQEDFEKLPFSSKADLRYAYPLEYRQYPMKKWCVSILPQAQRVSL